MGMKANDSRAETQIKKKGDMDVDRNSRRWEGHRGQPNLTKLISKTTGHLKGILH